MGAAIPSRADAVLRKQLDACYSIVVPMAVMDMIGAAMIASAYWSAEHALPLGAWLTVTLLTMLPRTVIAMAYRNRLPERKAPRLWARLLVAIAVVAGLLWGTALAWMVASGSAQQISFVVCVALSGVALTIVWISYWPVYAAFVSPMVLGIAAGFLVSPHPRTDLLALGALALLPALLITSRRLSGQVIAAYRLASDNEILVASLAERGRELEDACRNLEEVCRTDPLTGLRNRRALDARLEDEWARAGRVAGVISIVAIDVDHFKRFNDSWGHDEGDRCLRAVGAVLQREIRAGFDLAARHGGEEFMLVLPGIDRAGAAQVAERIRFAIERCQIEFALAGPVTLSLGVATTAPGPSEALAGFARTADEALYRAKQAGRNRVEIADRVTPIARAA